MATATLSAVQAGITRLRSKGGASPESLYDLVNGRVTAARTIDPRPGSAISAQLPAGTIGLALFNGVFQVFASSAVGPMPPGYNLNVLSHPDPDPSDPPELVRIWKAEPLMGGLYVVAEWSDSPDEAYHYWVLTVGASTWQPNKVYMLNDPVVATSPTGITFTAQRLNPADPVWEAGKEYQVGDKVEPSTFNGYRYVLVEADGSPPRSGATEPNWIAEEGAIVIEEADVEPPSTGPQQPPPAVPPRYNNPGGSGGSVLRNEGIDLRRF